MRQSPASIGSPSWSLCMRQRSRLLLVILYVAIMSLVSCTSLPEPVAAPAAATPSSTALASILTGEPQATDFDQITQAITQLYNDHPDVNSFLVKGVTYTPATRDKVLKVCREGGLAGDDAQRETQRILACAPLILFFYSYGQESGVPASTDIARHLYWYAKGNNSQESVEVLTNLLKSWAIE